jgi:NAD(P)-dependent dehydrogenase (short-subunit alcohol dehydrogenase family)
MLLSEKICIITGAASPRGIGRATAGIFAHHGGRAVILDLDEKQAKLAAAEIGEEHRGLACDVTDKSICLAAVNQVVREFGRVDVLINNAGITQGLTSTPNEGAADWIAPK